MGKFRDRTCVVCGDIEYNTATRSDTCLKCHAAAKVLARIEPERQLLEDLGYSEIELAGKCKHGKREWTFTHECGTKQTWIFPNIRKRLIEDADNIPCSYCGGQRRTKNGTAQSAENRKIKNPVGWIEYMQVVRRLTANTYALYKDEINPLNLVRGHNAYHLDHILPISEGYEQGLAPEFIARKENLQMLSAFDNLSKGRKV